MLPSSATERLAGTRFAEIRWFTEVDSTNTYLLGQARTGAADGLVAVADAQTAGRGRLGRSWVSPPGGSLLFSVLLRPDRLASGRAHLLTAALALAGAAACSRVAGVKPEVKWPNDLLVGDRKLAGILAEADVGPEGSLDAVVLGMGLNVAWGADVPEELAGMAVALDEVTGRDFDRGELLVETLVALEPRLAALDVLMAEYRAVCATLGRRVRVVLPSETWEGTAVDLTAEGHLVVQPEEGPARVLAAADVVHLR
jgi:BirA family biotin operon repressor/biotin-[acetyl-CoA-carboxylase] ligase